MDEQKTDMEKRKKSLIRSLILYIRNESVR